MRLSLVSLLVPSWGSATIFKAIDAPPAQIVRGQAASADEAIKKIYFSEPLDDLAQDRSRHGVDLVQLEVDRVRELIAAPGDPSSKRLTYVRYTSGDMRLARALIDARHAGIHVDILVDLNPVLTLESNDLEEMTTDFDRTLPRAEDAPGYLAYQAFLAGGFELGKNLFSQPIYRPSETERTPIFHEKAVVIERDGVPTRLFVSSANSAPNPRVNRTVEIEDEAISAYYMAHVRDLKVLFGGRQAHAIRDLPERAPLQVEYPDGSLIRMSFTDGKYNPNDNIVNVLRNQHLKSALLSQFAFTYARMADALVENLQLISPDARATLLLDDKFTDLVSWGVGLQLKGAMVLSPPFSNGNNRLLFPKSKDVAERIDLFVYQRGVRDEKTGLPRIETDEDGPPLARHVNHEKTTVLVDTAGRAYISFGSFNASGNFHNADVQLDIQVNEQSWVHRSFDDTIRLLIAQEKDVFAIPALEATIRNGLGRLTGHTDLQIDMKEARRFAEVVWWSNPRYVRSILGAIVDRPTTLHGVPSLEARRLAVDRFVEFLTDYNRLLRPKHRTVHQLMKVLSVIPVIANAPMTPYARKTLVETAFFGLVPDQRRNELVDEALVRFGHEKFVPGKSRAKPEATAQAFDWDNTVLVMPTTIRLFSKTSSVTRDVTTEEFATIRTQLGQTDTAFEHWEFRMPESFVQFRSTDDWRSGFFVPHLKQALGDPHGRALAFEALITALSNPKTAKSTYIVTARGHDVQEMIMGLVALREAMEKELFHIFGKTTTLHLPPRENFIAVSDAGAKISEAKADHLVSIIAKEFKYDGAKTFRFFEDDVTTRETVTARLATAFDDAVLARISILDPSEAPRTWSACERGLVVDDRAS